MGKSGVATPTTLAQCRLVRTALALLHARSNVAPIFAPYRGVWADGVGLIMTHGTPPARPLCHPSS
jgi:hypothetical protein